MTSYRLLCTIFTLYVLSKFGMLKLTFDSALLLIIVILIIVQVFVASGSLGGLYSIRLTTQGKP